MKIKKDFIKYIFHRDAKQFSPELVRDIKDYITKYFKHLENVAKIDEINVKAWFSIDEVEEMDMQMIIACDITFTNLNNKKVMGPVYFSIDLRKDGECEVDIDSHEFDFL